MSNTQITNNSTTPTNTTSKTNAVSTKDEAAFNQFIKQEPVKIAHGGDPIQAAENGYDAWLSK